MGIMNTQNKKRQTEYNKKADGTCSEVLFKPIGFDILDYYLGTEVNSDEGEGFYNLGVPQGKISMFIGHSQSGKTTLALQVAYNIVADLNGDVVLYDFERSTNDARSRIKSITGCDDDAYDSTFTVFKNQTMTIDDVKEYIFDTAATKAKLGKAAMIDWIDLQGNNTKIFAPTVIILDSWAVIRNKDILTDAKMDGNMVPASIAKSNGNFLTSVEHLLEDYNISLFIINHITTKISINPYEPRKIQLPGLQKDENIPGGNKAVFLASYIFRLSASAELKADADFGVSGRIVDVLLLKTRSGYNIKKIPLVYTAKQGFSNLLTNYWHLKENKALKACGSKGSALPGLPEKPFSMKNFIKTYSNITEVNEEFDKEIAERYSAILIGKSGEFLENNITEEENDLIEEIEE